MKHKEKTQSELHDFGQVMTLACLIFSAIGIWKRGTFSLTVLVLLSIGTLFFLVAAFSPERLRGIERKWMVFAEKLGTVVTFLVMGLTFYFIVTPIGLLMRLFRKDLLQIKIEKERSSYWEPVPEDGPGTRPFLPY